MRATEMVARDAPVLCLAFLLALPLLGADRQHPRQGHAPPAARRPRRSRGPRQRAAQLVDREQLAERLTSALVKEIPASHASLHVVEEAGADLSGLAHCVSEQAPSTESPRIAADLAAWLALSSRPLVVEEATFYGDALVSLKARSPSWNERASPC